MDSVAEEVTCVKLIVPVLNRFDLLKRMVESIDVEATVYVINNSGVIQDDFYCENPLVNVHWLELPTNLGVASSWNLGIKMLPFESRWFITSADTWFQPGALTLLETAKDDAVTLAESFPYWQTFAVGQKIVEQIGLFDEALHPIYFEDNDYERRVTNAGLRIDRLPLALGHDNSSTIKSSSKFTDRNNVTFADNSSYFNQKQVDGRFDEGRWSLIRRRVNSWD